MPSQSLIDAVYADETDEVFVVLLRITHPALAEPVLLANNTEDVVSNGETFIGFPFDITLFDDNEQTPRAQLEVQNVDRRIGDAVLALTSPALMDIMIVLASDPDTIELDFKGFELREVKGNATSVQASIVGIDLGNWPWPWRRATQAAFPGLYV